MQTLKKQAIPSLLLASAALLLVTLLSVGSGLRFGESRGEAPSETAPEPLPEEELVVQGLTRTVRYFVPTRVPERPALIVALHGGGGDGERFRRLTGRAFEAVAKRHGAVVAYPDALGGRWNDCRSGAAYRSALAGLDEGSFLEAVVDRAEEIVGRELSGTFVVGYSNGGHLVFRLALETPASFDAYAVIGANLPVPAERNCRSSDAGVSIMLVQGTEDPINPWAGGTVRAPGGVELGRVLSAEETVEHFVELAGASAPPVTLRFEDRAPEDGTRVETRTWDGAGEEEVRWMIIRGAGHTLPHQRAQFPASITGPTSRDVDGADEIWKFFAGHRPAIADTIDSR